MNSTKINITKRVLLGILIGLLVFFIALIASAKVTTTPSGSYYKLYFFDKISTKLFYSGASDKPNFVTYPFAAPVIELNTETEKNSNTVHWYCFNQAYSREVFQPQVTIDCHDQSYQFSWSTQLDETVIEQDTLADNILVLSDIHGDIYYLNSILTEMNIVDKQGHWHWQNNQIVVTGDSISKGPADFSVLWRLYQLAQQAKSAGGAVHVLLGNHENYQLHDNYSRLNADMRVKSFAISEKLTEVASPYRPNTVLGKWLRSRPVIIRLGNYLFTHGGLSQAHLDTNYTLAELNKGIWQYYKHQYQDQPPQQKLLKTEYAKEVLELTLGKDGLIWFRGQLRDKRSNTPSSAELARILQKYGADTLVLGHSAVENIHALVDGQVWPAHTEHDSGQVLLIEQGAPKARKLNTKWYDYESVRQQSRKTKRPLRFFKGVDGESEVPVVKKMFTEMSKIKAAYQSSPSR